jgi:UDP-glucose 4-epimerase
MNVVITGSSGLIGSGLSAELARRGHQVWAISRTPVSGLPGVHPVVADLSVASLPAGLPDTADVVVHLAQSARHREFPAHAMDVFHVNVASTAALLDWSRRVGVRQFILASSGNVGGGHRVPSYYRASKQSAELLAASYASVFQVLATRFFFVYGRGQKRGMLVPRLVDSVQTDGRIPLAGCNGPRLNPVHVDDAVSAVARAIDVNATGVIDIAGPEVLTVRAMAETIAQHMGRTAHFDFDASATAEDLVGDITDMSTRLVAPRRVFAEGVAELIPSSLRA